MNRTAAVPGRRTTGRIIVTLLLAFLCLNAWIQAVLKLLGRSDDPALLSAGNCSPARRRPWPQWVRGD